MRYFFAIFGVFLFASNIAFADFTGRGKLREKIAQAKQIQNSGEEIIIEINGLKRSFIAKGIRNDKKNQPLVMVLHGGGGNAQNAQMISDFSQKAFKEGFVVIYPNGTNGDKNILLTWNAKHCCGSAMRDNIDDIKFFDKLIDYSITNLNIDKTRIYVTGMSNGAMMTHQIGIHLSHKVTAIATIVGAMFGDEPMPKFATSALIINGALDDHIPMNGGKPPKNKQAWDGTPMKPVNFQAEFWRKANSCNANPVIVENDKTIRIDYACKNGADVKQIIVKDGGHAWFGGNAGRKKNPIPSTSINSTDEIWDFFSNFKK